MPPIGERTGAKPSAISFPRSAKHHWTSGRPLIA